MKTTSLIALAAAATAFAGTANAADLGGNCCADLEERIAELEATTARKGNRKVSLTVSGQVNELIYWWDDGVESNVYVGTNQYSNTRFRFVGEAKINNDWSAGYLLEIQAVTAPSNTQTAANDDPLGGLGIRQSHWYLKSKQLGKVSVGQASHATDDIVLLSLGGTATGTAANHDVAPGAGLLFNNGLGVGTVAPRTLLQFLDTDRANIIRYDSPTIAGFIVSASWGEDDMWDVALRYAGEFNGVKIAAGIGYHTEDDVTGDDGTANITVGGFGALDFSEVRGSASVLHEPTGLFVDFAAIKREFDDSVLVLGALGKSDFTYWNIRGGIYRKFFDLGKTSIFAEYAEADGALRGGTVAAIGAGVVTQDDVQVYGVGFQQFIDSAAMEIYAGWRHFSADLATSGTLAPGGRVRTEDIDTIYTGARIQF